MFYENISKMGKIILKFFRDFHEKSVSELGLAPPVF